MSKIIFSFWLLLAIGNLSFGVNVQHLHTAPISNCSTSTPIMDRNGNFWFNSGLPGGFQKVPAKIHLVDKNGQTKTLYESENPDHVIHTFSKVEDPSGDFFVFNDTKNTFAILKADGTKTRVSGERSSRGIGNGANKYFLSLEYKFSTNTQKVVPSVSKMLVLDSNMAKLKSVVKQRGYVVPWLQTISKQEPVVASSGAFVLSTLPHGKSRESHITLFSRQGRALRTAKVKQDHCSAVAKFNDDRFLLWCLKLNDEPWPADYTSSFYHFSERGVTQASEFSHSELTRRPPYTQQVGNEVFVVTANSIVAYDMRGEVSRSKTFSPPHFLNYNGVQIFRNNQLGIFVSENDAWTHEMKFFDLNLNETKSLSMAEMFPEKKVRALAPNSGIASGVVLFTFNSDMKSGSEVLIDQEGNAHPLTGNAESDFGRTLSLPWKLYDAKPGEMQVGLNLNPDGKSCDTTSEMPGQLVVFSVIE